MSSKKDSLTEVNKNQWPSLIDLFPTSEGLTARVSIKSQIYYWKNKSSFPSKIWAPYNQPKDGLVMWFGMSPSLDEYTIYSVNPNPVKLMKALKETKRINWKKPLLICHMMPLVQQPFINLLTEMKIPHSLSRLHIFHMPKEKSMRLKLEEITDIDFLQLGPECAKEINEAWPHKYENSELYFKNLLKYNMGFGIRGKIDNDLRGWAFIGVRGDFHAGHVKKEYRENGYAKYMVISGCKLMLERDIEVFATVVMDNIPSMNFVKELGFEMLAETYWVSNQYDIFSEPLISKL